MTSKQFFSLSLMILSLVMGLHWYKNKPAITKKPFQQRTSVRLEEIEDMDEFDDEMDDYEDDAEEVASKSSDEDGAEKSGASEEDAVAISPNDENSVEEGEATTTYEDEVLAYFATLKQTPFDTSPYTRMIEQLRLKAEEEKIALTAPKTLFKTTQLTAVYSASIMIGSQLVAVIDSKTYRKGETFDDMKITDISPELVVLAKDGDKFLIAKRGVNISIAEDGSYSLNDTFFDK